MLSKEEPDIHAREEDLAYKMLLLSWSLSEDVRQGLTYKAVRPEYAPDAAGC